MAAKWLFAEEFSDNALALLRSLPLLRDQIVETPHLHSEMTNVIYQRLRSGEITSHGANEALRRFLDFGVQLVEPPGTYEMALAIAGKYQLPTTYDALYVALTYDLEVDFWTERPTAQDNAGFRLPVGSPDWHVPNEALR